MQISIVGHAYTGRLRGVSWEQCTNFYVESSQTDGAKVPRALIGTPGTSTSYPAFATGLPRGMFRTSIGRIYCVCGSTLYRMPSVESDSGIVIGNISTGYGHIGFSDTGRYLIVVDGTVMYVHDMNDDNSGLKTPITGPQPSHTAFIGGWAIINNTFRDPAVSFPPTDNLVYYTPTPYDALNWSSTSDPNALSFFAAEGRADPVVSLIRAGDVIWLFGPASYECHMLSGNDRKPFTRVGGSLSDIGIAARYSAATIGQRVFWLGQTDHGGLSVYRSNGYDAQRISTSAIEQSVGAIDFTDAIGWTYQEEGHDFYVLTFRGSNLTWVWDDSEEGWHRRSSRVAGTDQETVWEPIYAASVGKTTYVCSNLYPRILKLSLEKYDEWDGRPIKSVRSFPVVWDDLKPVRHDRLVIDMATGVGLRQPGQPGYDPQMMMRYSDDSGWSYSNEYWEPMGLLGDRTVQVIFNRLGISTARVYEITITAAVKKQILGASLIAESSKRHGWR